MTRGLIGGSHAKCELWCVSGFVIFCDFFRNGCLNLSIVILKPEGVSNVSFGAIKTDLDNNNNNSQ